jgi:hypothetical protein
MRSLVPVLAALVLAASPTSAQELTDAVCREVAAGFARDLVVRRVATPDRLPPDATLAIAAPASGSLEQALRAALASSEPPFVVRAAEKTEPVDLLVVTTFAPGGSGSHRTADLVVELVDLVTWTTVARARWSSMSIPPGEDDDEALPLVGPFDLRAAADELARKVSERNAKGWPAGWPERPVVSTAPLRSGELVDPTLVDLFVRDALWSAGAVTLSVSRADGARVVAEYDRSKKVFRAPPRGQGIVAVSVEAETGEGCTRVTIQALLIDRQANRPIVTTTTCFSR